MWQDFTSNVTLIFHFVSGTLRIGPMKTLSYYFNQERFDDARKGNMHAR